MYICIYRDIYRRLLAVSLYVQQPFQKRVIFNRRAMQYTCMLKDVAARSKRRFSLLSAATRRKSTKNSTLQQYTPRPIPNCYMVRDEQLALRVCLKLVKNGERERQTDPRGLFCVCLFLAQKSGVAHGRSRRVTDDNDSN